MYVGMDTHMDTHMYVHMCVYPYLYLYKFFLLTINVNNAQEFRQLIKQIIH